MRRPVPWLAAVALLAAACGSAVEDSATTTVAATTETPATTTSTTIPEPSPSTTTTTAAPQGPLSFDFAIGRGEDNPALPDGEGEDWDASWTFAPSVVHHDGLFHLFYTGWGKKGLAIGYATSEDGLSFTRYENNPVLTLLPDDEDVDAGRAVVRILEDGTWEMFLGEWIDRNTQGNRVWRATATEPRGPWQIESAPLYESTVGQWNSRVVPQFIQPDGDIIYYDGIRLSAFAIGALLPDGDGGFTAYDDPGTAEGELAESDWILGEGADDEWDQANVGSPIIFPDGQGGYLMFYSGFWKEKTRSKTQWMWLGVATSDDGITWERYEPNPVVELAGENGYLWMSGVELDGTYYLYYAIQAGQHGIGVATGTITANT